MFQSYAESIQPEMAELPHIVFIIVCLLGFMMFFTVSVLLRKFLVMLKTPTTAIQNVTEGMLAEIGGVLAPARNQSAIVEPFKKREVLYLHIEAGVRKKKIPFLSSRKRNNSSFRLAKYEEGSKDIFLVKDETGGLVVANESFMNGLSTKSDLFLYKKKQLPQELLKYFPNADLLGQSLITGWRLRYYFSIKYIPCDQKVFGIGRVKEINVDNEQQKVLHGGVYIDQKLLVKKFFKPTLNSEGIIENFPDQHEIQTVTSAGKDSSRKERERAQIDYGGQTKQLAVLLFQSLLVAAIAIPIAGFAVIMVYSKYFL